MGTWLSSLLFAMSALAADPWQGYSDPARFAERLKVIDAADIASVQSIGTSVGDRDVSLIVIGAAPEKTKPALLVVGNVVAPHVVGSEITLAMADWLIAHAADPDVQRMLGAVTVYLLPRPNPDGVARVFGSPFAEIDGNDRKTDDDRDFSFGEDPPEDLNGDGWISSMRVADPDAGTYLPLPADPRILVTASAAKGERGAYRLFVEGIDNDHDEAWNEDPGAGVSFNRNFPAKYAPFSVGVGPNAVSEPETRAVADFCFDHPNIAAVLCFTPGDNVFFPPKPGGEEKIKTKIQPDDAPLHEHLAKEFQQLLGMKNPPPAAEGAGSFSDWSYLQFGRWTFATRGWWIPEPPKEEEKKEPEAKEEKEEKPDAKDDREAYARRALAWFEANKIDGFLPWTKIEHPDFPRQVVEVGGFRPFVLDNPPAAEIPALGEKHARFLITLADKLPRLTVTSAESKSQEGGVRNVRVTVANAGFLPTMSQMGAITKIPFPLNWELKLAEGATLLAGTARGQIPLLRPGDTQTIEWIVLDPPGKKGTLTFSIDSPAVQGTTTEIDAPAEGEGR